MAYKISEVESILKTSIEKALIRGSVLNELDEKADTLHAHASNFKSSAVQQSSWTSSLGTKLSEATNWVRNEFRRKKTWECDVHFLQH